MLLGVVPRCSNTEHVVVRRPESFKKMGGIWSELSETTRNNQKLNDAQWKG